MAKYHISQDGQPRICHAQKACRVKGRNGGQAEHFDNLQKAEKAAEKILEGYYGSSSTLSGSAPVSPGVSEILRNASNSSQPNKITEKYAKNNLLGGDKSKLEFLENISKKNISKETKAAIGKMTMRSDINLSYNDLAGEDFSVSQVDLMDEDIHHGDLKSYVAAKTKDLPWLS